MSSSVLSNHASGRWFSTVLKSTEVKWAIGGWAFFIAENAIISENRKYFIEDVFRGDDQMYHIMYGTFSTIATCYIGYGYFKLHRLYQQNKVVTAYSPPLSSIGMISSWTSACFGLVMISQAAPKMQMPLEIIENSVADKTDKNVGNTATNKNSTWKMQVRCPFDFSDRRNHDLDNPMLQEVSGMERITRHPGLWSIGFLGISNAFWQPNAALSLWMMGPAAVAFLGGQHNDSRFRRGIGGTLAPFYDCQTSNLPFAALLLGKQGNVWKSFQTLITEETKPLNAILGIGCASVWILIKARSRKISIYL